MTANPLQDADYDDLCGCVAVTFSLAKARDMEGWTPEAITQRARRLIRAGQRPRISNLSCPDCRGSGILRHSTRSPSPETCGGCKHLMTSAAVECARQTVPMGEGCAMPRVIALGDETQNIEKA